MSLLPALGEAPETEESLEQVVADDDVLDLIRLSVLHKPEKVFYASVDFAFLKMHAEKFINHYLN